MAKIKFVQRGDRYTVQVKKLSGYTDYKYPVILSGGVHRYGKLVRMPMMFFNKEDAWNFYKNTAAKPATYKGVEICTAILLQEDIHIQQVYYTGTGIVHYFNSPRHLMLCINSIEQTIKTQL